MIYVLIYWIVGVMVNMLLTLLIERTEKHTWVSFLLYWIVFPFIFPLTLLVLKDDISSAFKKMKKKPMETAPSTPLKKQEATETKEDDPFEKEWQAFIKDTMPDKDVTLIERKIVVDNDMVSKDYKKMVMYLEDSPNEMFNAFIKKNHHVISEIFKQWGYFFMYAPKEMETIANYYGTTMPKVKWDASKLLELQGCRLDEPIGTAMAVIEDVDWNDEQDCWVATMRGVQLDAENEHDLTEQIRGYWGILNKKYQEEKKGRSHIRYRMANDNEESNIRYRMAEDNEEPNILFRTAEDNEEPNILFRTAEDNEEPKCHIAADMYGEDWDGAAHTSFSLADDVDDWEEREQKFKVERERKIRETEERKMLHQQPSKSSDESFPLFRHILNEVRKDREIQANDFLIEVEDEDSETLTQEDEQLLREIQERIERLHHSGIRQLLIEQIVGMTVKPSLLQVTADARILLTDYGKEVSMLPIDKAVYIFYLRHPEGISIKSLTDHKDELMMLYARVLGKTKLADKQKASVERLCDPWDNSINEKLSRIRKSFCAEVHESVADNYIIQGARGGIRSITLDEELIELGDWGR